MKAVSVLAIAAAALGASGCSPRQAVEATLVATPQERFVQPTGFPADRPYSFAVWAGDTLHLSAQPGMDPLTGSVPEGIAAQTRQAMENIGAILEAAGLDHSSLVKCHVYLRSMDDYTGMNKVYGSFFSGRVPARTTVEATGLPHASDLQIGCLAYRDRDRIAVVTPPPGSLPAPLGPYSAAVWAGDTLYLSGMGGQFPEDRRLPEGLGPQVEQTLVNIRTTLKAAGLRLEDAVASNVYLTVPDQIEDLMRAYGTAFASTAEPPRSLILLSRLPGAIKTEITFVATKSGDRQSIEGTDQKRPGVTALRVGGVLYAGSEWAPEAGSDFDRQFREVLRRLQQTVAAGGMQWRDVASIQIYVSDMSDLARLDRIYREVFADARPARTVVGARFSGAGRVSAALVAFSRSMASR